MTTEPNSALLTSKIVGGEAFGPEINTYVVYLEHQGSQICGGALISTLHVLTAAHCVHRFQPSEFGQVFVLVGSLVIKTAFPRFRIQNIVVHPDFNALLETPVADIALIHVSDSS